MNKVKLKGLTNITLNVNVYTAKTSNRTLC